MTPQRNAVSLSRRITVAIVAGARPNFMKVAPLMDALSRDEDLQAILIHTGQHYDDVMSGTFFRDLGIPKPDYHLEVGSGSHAAQTAEIMKRIESVLLERQPGAVVVVGDVNSTMAAALVASKLGVAVIHIEAGLRSFDRTMPEEINRVVTDSISDLLLITEESGRTNLLREGISPDRIHMVGNLMIDSLERNVARARQSDIRARLGVNERYGLVTLHRPANVDDHSKLSEILGALEVISSDLPLVWPMHPRARARLDNNSVRIPAGIRIVNPLGYVDFLCMQANAVVVLTDSGGIQEETTALAVPCLTLRDNTERPVTVTCGTNRLAGTNRETILASWRELQATRPNGQRPPMWDGSAGVRCRHEIRRFFGLASH